ncbi:MAG: hypothetical protein PF689_10995 [Deltaproteobacteria bacterium]|jgi:hypothetical protein|nr:hypothetical protein [Deltaproteobacteria bacterium]
MKFIVSLTVIILFGTSSCNNKKKTQTPSSAKPIEKVIPLTVANLKGHKMLYDEGWFLITSTRKCLEYAKKNAISSSRQALIQWGENILENTRETGRNLSDELLKTLQNAKNLYKNSTENTVSLLQKSHSGALFFKELGNTAITTALQRFVKGNLALAKNTRAERDKLRSLPHKYYQDLKKDFSNIYGLTQTIKQKLSKKLGVSWRNSFKKAVNAWQEEYEKSGQQENSLKGLVNIIYGYGKALFFGIIKPFSKTAAKTAGKTIQYGIFLPVATATLVLKSTIVTTGLALYYTGKSGIKIIAPTVEAGLLTGLSLLAYAQVPIIYTGAAAAGFVNQVAMTAAVPTYATGRAATVTAYEITRYSALMAYDFGKTVSKVALNQISTGLVLGYNALTAIPAHLYLFSVDSVIFLAWDGPRLVLASAKGKICYKNCQSDKKQMVSLGDLPVGTITDLKALKSEKGIKTRIITKDPEIIKKVLQKIPQDLRPKTKEKSKTKQPHSNKQKQDEDK